MIFVMPDESQSPQPEYVSPTDETLADQRLQVSPTEETLPDLPIPSWPPPQPMFRRRETFSVGLASLIIILALLLIVGSLGLITYTTAVQYRATLHTQATLQVQLTTQVRGTAQAKVQATDQALATVQAGIYATATAQSAATATATATVDAATATATALGDLLTQATSGTPTLDDPLSDNTMDPTSKSNWDQVTGTVNSSCVFTGGDYHASESRKGYFQPCLAEATNFSDFAYQMQMIIDKGTQGGILFRANSTKGAFYFFRIGINGSYALDLYQSGSQAMTLSSGFSSAISTGVNSSNTIAVLANKSTLYLYANQQYITSVTDSTLHAGQIGVAAYDSSTPTEIEFSSAQVWSLSTNPTPSPSASP